MNTPVVDREQQRMGRIVRLRIVAPLAETPSLARTTRSVSLTRDRAAFVERANAIAVAPGELNAVVGEPA